MLKKTIKNYELLNLLEGIGQVNKMEFESNKRFSYAIILNGETLAPHGKAILAVSKPAKEYAEYEEKREELVNACATKDENGDIEIKDNRWIKISPEKQEELNAQLEVLDTEYADILVKREKDLEDFKNILDEDIEVDVQVVSIDDIPEEVGKNINLLKLLFAMID